MIALLVHLGISIVKGEACFWCIECLKEVIRAFLISVTIIVVAVPEGLPLAVTIALAFSVNKMKDENNLVKQLQCCEVMGGATNVCTDKTGTLTQNIMSVASLFIANKTLERENIVYVDKDIMSYFCQAACINSGAFPVKDKVSGKYIQVGNKTECALLELADQAGFDYNSFRPNSRIVKVVPFSSARKKMTTIYKMNDQTYRIFVKGASEVIVEKCT
jgi:magnesium-transporting ATPase (P-type)